MLQLSDEELLARYRAKRESDAGAKCLEELFGRYHARVATWCLRFTGDRENAADLAQDIFLRVYRSLESFRGDAKFSTWLFTVARNHCMNERKARAARVEQIADSVDYDLPDTGGASIHSVLEQRELQSSMRSLVDETLDDTEKKVMVLHFSEEMTLDAITRLLGLTNASGARAHVVSAKRKLAVAVQRWQARNGGMR